MSWDSRYWIKRAKEDEKQRREEVDRQKVYAEVRRKALMYWSAIEFMDLLERMGVDHVPLNVFRAMYRVKE